MNRAFYTPNNTTVKQRKLYEYLRVIRLQCMILVSTAKIALVVHQILLPCLLEQVR